MSFNNKSNRPDSKDAAKLRKEYEDKARQFRESGDSASRAKLKDDKAKSFLRVVEQQTHERRDALAAEHKVLIRMGKMKSREQVAEETKKLAERREQRVERESIVV